MNKIKVAIVGAGFISASKHVPGFKNLGNQVEIVAISDLNRDGAAKVAKEAAIPAVYTDAEEMIAKEKPDLLDICTPPATHAKLALTAMEQGCNLLIEKPMALTLEDCDRIVENSHKLGLKVCVCHTGLFYEPFMEARSLVESGKYGQFRGMRVIISTPTDYMTSSKDHWCHKLPGGAVGETGPHPVYMSLAFLKSVDSVTVDAAKLLPQYPWSAYEDYRINLVSQRGLSSININYATRQWLVWVEIACEDATVFADLHGRCVTVLKRPELGVASVGKSLLSQVTQISSSALRTTFKQLTGNARGSTHATLIKSYVESLISGRPAPVTAEEGREAVKVMAMIARDLDDKQAAGSGSERIAASVPSSAA